jgi:aminomethyltransferase
MSLLSTPFHARAVDENRGNVWKTRRGYTLAHCYRSADEEVLAAHFGAVMADLSWQWRAVFSGGAVEDFVTRAFTRKGAALPEGEGVEVLWLNDGGAVRGRGFLIRVAKEKFLLLSPEEDRDWLFFASGLYGVSCDDQPTDGILALAGPYAEAVLAAAGIDMRVAPNAYRSLVWRGLEIAVSRLGLGYELWCAADDALILWDRLRQAGGAFALMPAGLEAVDTLLFERGVLTPGLDFTAARDGFVSAPSVASLGLSALIDKSGAFNGKKACLADGQDVRLQGVILGEKVTSLPAALEREGRPTGTLLTQHYSPTLRSMMGLCVTDGSMGPLEASGVSGRPLPLPVFSLVSENESKALVTEISAGAV